MVGLRLAKQSYGSRRMTRTVKTEETTMSDSHVGRAADETPRADSDLDGADHHDDGQDGVAAAAASGEPQVVDDPDVPADPDERTRAEIEAAQSALYAPAASRRRHKGPRSIALLLLVIATVIGLGVYVVYWFDQMRVRNEQIQLRELEKRHVMSGWQQRYKVLRFGPDSDVQPPGVVYRPLAPGERARYDVLIKQYGTQFEPTDIERRLIDETKGLQAMMQPATGPATSP